MRKKDGSYIWVHDLGRKVMSEDNRLASCRYAVDITEEKQMRDRIKEMYEEELSYFAELSSADGSIQGSLNITTGRLESYLSTADTSIAKVEIPTRIPLKTWRPLPWTRFMGMESATALTGSGCCLITRWARWITALSSFAETTAA
ncbi:MAG: hypothetical protein ACLTW9_10070 [Enterocloster sp.]